MALKIITIIWLEAFDVIQAWFGPAGAAWKEGICWTADQNCC